MRPRSAPELVLDVAAADPPPDAACKGATATPAGARGAQRQGPETLPSQPSGAAAFAAARGMDLPVIASPEDILRAREIREQLKKKYLDRSSETCVPLISTK
jgi:hypothetical protein